MIGEPQIKSLHAAFCEATGATLSLSYMRQTAWFALAKAGVTPDDVRLVVSWTKSQIGKGNGFSELSLQFSAMVADTDKFEERLALARASARVKPKREGAVTRSVPGGSVTRIEPLPDPEPSEAGKAAAAELFNLRKQFKR